MTNGAKLAPLLVGPVHVPRTSAKPTGSAPSKTRSNAKAILLVFEGVDGVGKTTLVNRLQRVLRSKGVRCRTASFPGKTPGTLGAHVYALYHDPKKFNVSSISQTALQLLVTAAHVEAIELLVRPSLEKGITVILDRYWWSTWVYGKASGVTDSTLSKLIEIEEMSWNDHQPAALFFLTRRTRSRKRKGDTKQDYQLNKLYKSLVERELKTGRHPIFVVTNDGSIENAMSQLWRCLTAIGLPTV